MLHVFLSIDEIFPCRLSEISKGSKTVVKGQLEKYFLQLLFFQFFFFFLVSRLNGLENTNYKRQTCSKKHLGLFEQGYKIFGMYMFLQTLIYKAITARRYHIFLKFLVHSKIC